MADKKLQDLNNTRTSVVPGDQIAIGSTDGQTYKAALTIFQGFLLDNSLTTSTIKAPQSVVVKTAIDAINTILTTDNASLDDFQKITDAIEAIQATLTVHPTAVFHAVNWSPPALQSTIQNWYNANSAGTNTVGNSPAATFGNLPTPPSDTNYHVWLDSNIWYYKINNAGVPWSNMTAFAKSDFGAFISFVGTSS